MEDEGIEEGQMELEGYLEDGPDEDGMCSPLCSVI
jgi:hypothetical protein